MFSKQVFAIGTLSEQQTFCSRHKLCNPSSLLVPTTATFAVHTELRKSFFQLLPAATPSFSTAAPFLSHQARFVCMLLNCLSPSPLFIYQIFCLRTTEDASSITYLCFPEEAGLCSSRLTFIPFTPLHSPASYHSMSLRSLCLLPLHLQKSDNRQAISMLGHQTSYTGTQTPLSLRSFICLRPSIISCVYVQILSMPQKRLVSATKSEASRIRALPLTRTTCAKAQGSIP